MLNIIGFLGNIIVEFILGFLILCYLFIFFIEVNSWFICLGFDIFVNWKCFFFILGMVVMLLYFILVRLVIYMGRFNEISYFFIFFKFLRGFFVNFNFDML